VPLVRAFAALWLISAAFPVAASLLHPALPAGLGTADVALAAILVALGLGVAVRAPGPFGEEVMVTAFAAYRYGSLACLALVALFFATGDRIAWHVLLPGLAWRAWLAAWVLPSALTLARGSAR
jgi:hypothetical protein